MGKGFEMGAKFELARSIFQFEPKPPTMIASSVLLNSSFDKDLLEFFLMSRHKLDTEKSLHLEIVAVDVGAVSTSGLESDFDTGVVGVEINMTFT